MIIYMAAYFNILIYFICGHIIHILLTPDFMIFINNLLFYMKSGKTIIIISFISPMIY